MKAGVIYRGPSLIDGSSIIVVATYSDRNTKTGKVLQTYILMEHINPLEASKTGADYGICGDCNLRGRPTTDPARKQAEGRDCYVVLGQGPLIVWKGYHRGIYPMADSWYDRTSLGQGRFIRVGTYGDPAAAPTVVWEQLLQECSGYTAYSHQSGWRPDIAMQSVDSYPQAWDHWRSGRRTFRIVTSVDQLDTAHEVLCPASKEAGRRVQCTACKLCKGSAQAKSIAIVQH
jgi:hypothetical protein